MVQSVTFQPRRMLTVEVAVKSNWETIDPLEIQAELQDTLVCGRKPRWEKSSCSQKKIQNSDLGNNAFKRDQI